MSLGLGRFKPGSKQVSRQQHDQVHTLCLVPAAKHSSPWALCGRKSQASEFSFPVDADQGHPVMAVGTQQAGVASWSLRGVLCLLRAVWASRGAGHLGLHPQKPQGEPVIPEESRVALSSWGVQPAGAPSGILDLHVKTLSA